MVTDFIAPLVPIGLGFGRLGNFLNTELPGRITDSAMGLHYPCAYVRQLSATCYGEFEVAMRHLSSLYQGIGEGIVLFAVVWFYSARERPTGSVSGIFLNAHRVITTQHYSVLMEIKSGKKRNSIFKTTSSK